MKLNGISLNIQHEDTEIRHQDYIELIDPHEFGDQHVMTSIDTPMRKGAFDLSDEQKKREIEKHFRAIMYTLGLDLTDDSLKGTPARVAKMYVEEIFSGLNPENEPKIALFDNKYAYNEMLVEKNITLYSSCEHHFVPIIGKAHIAYISSGKVIGLSKLNRIAQFYAKRPQVQERLTVQIGKHLQRILETDSVAVIMDAEHLCVSSRGIQDVNSSTVSSFYGGEFENKSKKEELFNYLR
ncbi:MAG: GTP cyclohydrolase I FolE [Crocinitomicaceae bacterium]|jgi:GTP cyclohydrolase I